MKRTTSIFMAAVLAMAAARPAQGQSYVTVENLPACLTAEALTDFVTFASERNTAGLSQLVSSGRCIVLRGGIRVQRRNARGIGRVQIRLPGTDVWFWTLTEATEYRPG